MSKVKIRLIAAAVLAVLAVIWILQNGGPVQMKLLFVTVTMPLPALLAITLLVMVDWQHRLEQRWGTLHFGEAKVETGGEQHAFEVPVYLNDIDPSAVRVELYAGGVNGGSPVRQEMTRKRELAGAAGGYAYSATVSSARPATDYTARVIPHCAGVAIPLENVRILWQR
jgi:hypothetical protein